MVIVIAEEHVDAAMEALHSAGEVVWRIGTVRKRNVGEMQTIIE